MCVFSFSCYCISYIFYLPIEVITSEEKQSYKTTPLMTPTNVTITEDLCISNLRTCKPHKISV